MLRTAGAQGLRTARRCPKGAGAAPHHAPEPVSRGRHLVSAFVAFGDCRIRNQALAVCGRVAGVVVRGRGGAGFLSSFSSPTPAEENSLMSGSLCLGSLASATSL